MTLVATGSFFTEPSGNVTGAVLLMAVIASHILGFPLTVGHIGFARASRLGRHRVR